MGFKVAMVMYQPMIVPEMQGHVKGTGAEVSLYTEADTEEKLISVCADADCVITNQSYFPFTPRVFREIPKCRFLITASIGYDALDIPSATDLGIGIVNLKGFCSEELAEHAMALLLDCARYIGVQNTRIKSGRPAVRQTDKAGQHMTILKNKTLGIIGFGNAGKALVPKARGFEMNILAYDPFIDVKWFEKFQVTPASLDNLLEESDFIAIHADLNSSSLHMIGLEQFKKMKPVAFIVNTARGPIIDEQALMTAISEGYIAGAGLDVNEPEPVQPDNPLLKFDNVIFTGHRAGSSRESRVIWGIRPAEEVARIMRREWPVGLVNPEVKDKYVVKWGSMNQPQDIDSDK
jgi:D-3-phosphoglycerate dehydrogenase / 2-oxoglutarate reductase